MKEVIENVIYYILNDVEKYGINDIALCHLNMLLSEYTTL